jgi:hypothetical protein
MARILVASYLVRFPVGGYLSWVLQWLLGFQRLGHDVYFVEKAGWPGACFDPRTGTMGDSCASGTAAVHALLSPFGLGEHWCFVDAAGGYHGLSRRAIDDLFRSADLYVDLGLAHGEWQQESATVAARVLVDSDPCYTQILWEQHLEEALPLPEYDLYFSVGQNIGTAQSTSPTAGKTWRHVVNPVNVDLFSSAPPDGDAPFTTIMSWHSGRLIRFNGTTYGQKDLEFMKFLDLPRLVSAPLEVAVSGDVPTARLQEAGWRVRDSVHATRSFSDFRSYIAGSAGEFGVCKNVYVACHSGWFSDRGAAYLASGRPVVMQDTGFSAHLPCGCGLFAVKSLEDAAEAIQQIAGDWPRHSLGAREIAEEYLDAPKVLGRFLDEVGLSR